MPLTTCLVARRASTRLNALQGERAWIVEVVEDFKIPLLVLITANKAGVLILDGNL